MLIPVTLKTGSVIWLAARHILTVAPTEEGGTLVEVNKGNKNTLYNVTNPPNEILARLGVLSA